VVWNRDVQPHNKIDDTIDNSTNEVFDIVVNFRSCPTASDLSALNGFSTNQMHLTYLSSVALGNVAKTNITQIAAMTNVAFIEQQFGFQTNLTVSVPSMCVNAGSVSCAGNARALGYNGAGINIAIIDTGVDTTHQAFTATPLIGAYNAVTKTFGFANNNVADGFGHGTHVASIALGQATANEGEGVAPASGLIVVKVFNNSGMGAWADAVDGLQTLYDQSQSGTWTVNVINMSFGQTDALGNPIPSDGTDAFSQLINLAESMGIVVTAAAGNNGPNNVGLATPAAATRALTVAASQTQNTTTRADDTIACFSSRGPRTATAVPFDDLKPDVAAPGTHLVNCVTHTATGILAAKANSGVPNNGTVRLSGTSMAAPHVAGVAALIMQAKPGINAGSVKQLIIDTATAPNGNKQPNWQVDSGWGYVNAYAAVSAVALTDLTYPSYPPPVSWESPDISIAPDPAIINQPNTATVMVQNRGPNDAYNVRVQFGVYVFSASTPTFENIGTVHVPQILNGQTIPVSINWTPQPAIQGHNCLKVDIGYGADSDFSNNGAQRNILAQQSPVQFMLQNTATENASTIQLIPTWGPNIGGSSNNWTFRMAPTNVVLAADDCPVPVTAELFPTANAQPGEKQALRIAAVVGTPFGPIYLGGVTITGTHTNLSNTNTFLPSYRVIQYGAAPSQAQALANFLNINNTNLFTTNGEVAYIDPANWLAVPTSPVTNSTVISNLLARTENPFPDIPIRFEQLNFSALSNLTLFSSNAALGSAASAFAYANLTPQLGTPVIGHSTLSAFLTNDSNVVVSNSTYLDTQVNYQFTDGAGYPMVGPGAQVQVTYGPTGQVTRLHYSAPQLVAGTPVQIIPSTVASNRAGSILDPRGTFRPTLVPRLVYYVPRWPWTNPCLTCPPPNLTNTVIPWYEVGGTANVTNPITGQPSVLNLMPVMIPATDDRNFAPTASLSASSLGTQVVASVTVGGGMPPYTYAWAASSTSLSSNTGSSVSYTPVFRAAPPTLNIAPSNNLAILSWADPSAVFVLQSSPNLLQGIWTPVTGPVQTNNGLRSMTVSLLSPRASFFRLFLSATQTVSQAETITVIVTDANGVFVQAAQTLSVQATPKPAAAIGPGHKVIGVIDWGTESPYDPGLGTQDRNDWRSGMSQPGGGVERFTWTGGTSWKLDFIEEPTGIDHWEVDNADMVFYVGHGNPQVITFTAGPGPDPTRLWFNSPPRAWGDNDQEWMCFLSCDVLQFNDGGNLVWDRWGPDFDGLHILTGFRTLAWAQTGFPAVYTDNLLGWRHFLFFRIPWPPMSVVNSWFSAAADRQNRPDGTGRAAALGPIGPGGVCDINDYYWGRGPVGPTISAGLIRGWWYVSQP
jgi:subtilisin family serine protease